MHARSRVHWLSHPKFKATWVAIAAGSLAGLAVLGACSDDVPVSKIAGPATIPGPRFVGQVGDTHHRIVVCVNALSSPGTYSFNVVEDVLLASPEAPWFERTNSSDPDFPGSSPVQNTLGPFIPGDIMTSPVSMTPGNCEDVFVRMNTCPGSDPTANPPVLGTCSADPYDNAGNRLWTFSNLILNPYGAVDITFQPQAGVTYTVTCTNNDTGLPQTAGCGPAPAYSSAATYQIGRSASFGGFIWRALTVNNNVPPVEGANWTQVTPPLTSDPIFTAANVFHGSSVTYLFTRTETPCPAGDFTWEIADGVGEANWPAGNVGDILIRYDQFPAPNDNSYGVNAVGWPSGHTFGNLTGSDKAGVQIKNGVGTVVLSMEVDYLSAKTGTPSGYASLGVTGGDGDMLVGTAAGIQATTSLANNLNNTGYCVALNCTVAGTNLLVNSPPTDAAHTTYDLANPAAHGLWDFHNTYYVRITPGSNPALAGFDPSTWTVEPNLTVLHNSPAKPCPAGPFNCDDITVGNKTFGSKEVKVDVNNINQTQDAFITGVHITWPVGTNGALKSVKRGGDVIWSGTNATGTANLVLADLLADPNKRKIAKHNDADIKFTFANNVSQTLADYTASLDFGDSCNKVILP
jgi:hypothetical protein